MTRKKKSVREIDIESLARGYTPICMKTLGGWVTGPEVDPELKIKAIGMLMDRGWGRPPSTTKHTGADGESDIRVLVRTIFENKK